MSNFQRVMDSPSSQTCTLSPSQVGTSKPALREIDTILTSEQDNIDKRNYNSMKEFTIGGNSTKHAPLRTFNGNVPS
jgi:hypothetical protein